MRRVIRKPVDMKIHQYFARFLELNSYLKRFPPFIGDKNMLPNDEILEHAEFSIPNSWQQQMVLHNFNAASCTLDQFTDFCERLEVSESLYNSTHKKSQKAKTQKSNSGDSTEKTSKKHSGKRKYYCLYHGDNTTHTTDDCKVLKAQAERMSANHANKGGGKYKKYQTFGGCERGSI